MMRKLVACFVAALGLAAFAHAQGPRAATIDQQVRQNLALTAYTIQRLDLPADPVEMFTVHLDLGGQPVDLDLSLHSVRAEGFKVLLQDASGAMTEVPAPPVNTYRGVMQQAVASRAAAGLNADGLSAMVTVGEGGARQTWFIQPLSEAVPGAARTAHVVYREQDRVELPGVCGVEDDARPRMDPHLPPMGGTDGTRVCQIACEADFQYFQLLGSNETNTTNDINTIVNNVSNIYENDCHVEFQVTTVIIRTSAAANPYTSSTSGTLLAQMASHWAGNQGSVVRDIAHLFTGRELSGSVIGVAYLSGVCSFQIGYGLVQSRFTGNMAFRTALSAHELGHNFSAQHCDGACNPCYIMCSGLGGCNGVISTFEPCNRTVIENYSNTRPCLTIPPPPVIALPFSDTFPSTQLDPLKWANNNGAGVTPTAGAPSAPNALLFIQAASIETKDMNTAAPGRPIFVAFRAMHAGVEAGKRLDLECFNEFNSTFQPMGSVVSDGVDQLQFGYQEFEMPLTGLSNTKGKVRFKANGTEFDDAWSIDDVTVSIYCRADVNKDGALNLADFGVFQTAFASGNFALADYNNDGVLNLADFGAFQTSFAIGCY